MFTIKILENLLVVRSTREKRNSNCPPPNLLRIMRKANCSDENLSDKMEKLRKVTVSLTIYEKLSVELRYCNGSHSKFDLPFTIDHIRESDVFAGAWIRVSDVLLLWKSTARIISISSNPIEWKQWIVNSIHILILWPRTDV